MKNKKKWYQQPSNWLLLVGTIILVPILIMNLCIMYQAKTNKDEVPSVFGFKPFIVLSGSMEPEIHKGDMILTKNINPAELKKDDVLAFRDAENTVTTHRIIDIVENDGVKYFITKGDNNSSQDKNLVEYEDVEGIYLFHFPGVGSIMASLSEPTTVLILVMGITLIFIIGFSISNKKQKEIEKLEFLEYKRMKEQQEKEEAENKKTSKNQKKPNKKA